MVMAKNMRVVQQLKSVVKNLILTLDKRYLNLIVALSLKSDNDIFVVFAEKEI